MKLQTFNYKLNSCVLLRRYLGNVINTFIIPISYIFPATLSKYYDEKRIIEVKTILNNTLRYFLLISILDSR
jgi:O-antigen/teichoic acid export membrane protein